MAWVYDLVRGWWNDSNSPSEIRRRRRKRLAKLAANSKYLRWDSLGLNDPKGPTEQPHWRYHLAISRTRRRPSLSELDNDPD